MKYGDVTLGQVEAFINKIGGLEVWESVLRNESSVEIKSNSSKLFDKNGRRIPSRFLNHDVCDSDRSFKLLQPEINYVEVIERLKKNFPAQVEGADFLSAEEFKKRAESLIEQLRQDKSLANLLKGVWLPICLPKLFINDYGRSLEDVFFPAIENSYRSKFPDRSFDSFFLESVGNVSVVSGSRHEILLRKMIDGPVVGIVFFPLQGFSALAQREQLEKLPESILLCGAVDIATAMTAYPEVLVGNQHRPSYDCSAILLDENSIIDFHPEDDYIYVGLNERLNQAHGAWSGGLIFVG